jgi:hypothetical protein
MVLKINRRGRSSYVKLENLSYSVLVFLTAEKTISCENELTEEDQRWILYKVTNRKKRIRTFQDIESFVHKTNETGLLHLKARKGINKMIQDMEEQHKSEL